MSDEEDNDCPLCMEEIDLSDKYFRPCPCGYRLCRFCWNHIKEDLNALCPACRRPYLDENIEFKPVSPEEFAQIKNAKKRQQKERKEQDMAAKKLLANTKFNVGNPNVRVVQKNLVYVLGLPLNLATDEILRSHDYFGQYGKITKIVVNKRTPTAGPNCHPSNPATSHTGVYITYASKADASRAIEAVDGTLLDGKIIRQRQERTNKAIAFATVKKEDHEVGLPVAAAWAKTGPIALNNSRQFPVLGADVPPDELPISEQDEDIQESEPPKINTTEAEVKKKSAGSRVKFSLDTELDIEQNDVDLVVLGSGALDDDAVVPGQVADSEDNDSMSLFEHGYSLFSKYNGLFNPFGEEKLKAVLLQSLAGKQTGVVATVNSNEPTPKSRFEGFFPGTVGPVSNSDPSEDKSNGASSSIQGQKRPTFPINNRSDQMRQQQYQQYQQQFIQQNRYGQAGTGQYQADYADSNTLMESGSRDHKIDDYSTAFFKGLPWGPIHGSYRSENWPNQEWKQPSLTYANPTNFMHTAMTSTYGVSTDMDFDVDEFKSPFSYPDSLATRSPSVAPNTAVDGPNDMLLRRASTEDTIGEKIVENLTTNVPQPTFRDRLLVDNRSAVGDSIRPSKDPHVSTGDAAKQPTTPEWPIKKPVPVNKEVVVEDGIKHIRKYSRSSTGSLFRDLINSGSQGELASSPSRSPKRQLSKDSPLVDKNTITVEANSTESESKVLNDEQDPLPSQPTPVTPKHIRRVLTIISKPKDVTPIEAPQQSVVKPNDDIDEIPARKKEIQKPRKTIVSENPVVEIVPEIEPILTRQRKKQKKFNQVKKLKKVIPKPPIEPKLDQPISVEKDELEKVDVEMKVDLDIEGTRWTDSQTGQVDIAQTSSKSDATTVQINSNSQSIPHTVESGKENVVDMEQTEIEDAGNENNTKYMLGAITELDKIVSIPLAPITANENFSNIENELELLESNISSLYHLTMSLCTLALNEQFLSIDYCSKCPPSDGSQLVVIGVNGNSQTVDPNEFVDEALGSLKVTADKLKLNLQTHAKRIVKYEHDITLTNEKYDIETDWSSDNWFEKVSVVNQVIDHIEHAKGIRYIRSSNHVCPENVDGDRIRPFVIPESTNPTPNVNTSGFDMSAEQYMDELMNCMQQYLVKDSHVVEIEITKSKRKRNMKTGKGKKQHNTIKNPWVTLANITGIEPERLYTLEPLQQFQLIRTIQKEYPDPHLLVRTLFQNIKVSRPKKKNLTNVEKIEQLEYEIAICRLHENHIYEKLLAVRDLNDVWRQDMIRDLQVVFETNSDDEWIDE
ncbi:transcriptional repressor general negative regulator of transcription subunit 4 [Globomyces sp. JEL0801]|nr:transcriptional repressor general negative regulator of transcription subunit 4 [Globomyces sp. JEL0801]